MDINTLNEGDTVVIESWGGAFEIVMVDRAGGCVLVSAPDFIGEWVPADRVVEVLPICGRCRQPIWSWERRDAAGHVDCLESHR